MCVCVILYLNYCPLVKTRKEAKRMAVMDSIAARKAKIEELKRTIQDQRTKRDEYAALLSQQSLGIFLLFMPLGFHFSCCP